MNSLGSTFLGVVAGTALGAAMGILFAPDKGSKTRKVIVKEAEKTKNKFADQASDFASIVADKMSTHKKTLEEKLEAIASDASHGSEDIISALEKKLEILKTKNKEFRNNVKSTTATT